MQLNYRSQQERKRIYDETKKWLEEMLHTPTEEMEAFFTARMDNYESKHMRHWGDVYEAIPSYLPDDAGSILDLGCGSGLQFDFIFQKYPHVKMTGIDLCSAMLDEFRKKHGDKDVELIAADYFAYPFEEKEYDIVLSVQSLHHFKHEKKKEIYKKIYRAVKNGGAYFEFDYMAQDDEFEKLNLDYYEKRRQTHGVEKNELVHIDLPLTLEHQIQLLEYAGFKKITVLNKPFEKHNIVFLQAVK